MKLTVYGSKGSSGFSSKTNRAYGGNTSCYRVDTGGHTILLDCGTGLLQFAEEMRGQKELTFDILLSHLHADHIAGVPVFEPFMKPEHHIRIFTQSRADRPLSSQIFGLYKPPYWPVDLEALARVQTVAIDGHTPFFLHDDVKVIPFQANHPDRTTSFRIEADKTVVYLLDFEINESTLQEELVAFAKDADVIIFDSCYLPDHYPAKKNWGHSTFEFGLQLAEAAHCKLLLLAHFSYEYPDEVLDTIERRLKQQPVNCRIAFDGMEYEF